MVAPCHFPPSTGTPRAHLPRRQDEDLPVRAQEVPLPLAPSSPALCALPLHTLTYMLPSSSFRAFPPPTTVGSWSDDIATSHSDKRLKIRNHEYSPSISRPPALSSSSAQAHTPCPNPLHSASTERRGVRTGELGPSAGICASSTKAGMPAHAAKPSAELSLAMRRLSLRLDPSS